MDFTIKLSLLHGSAIWRPSEDTSGRDVKFLDFLAESFINESANDNSTKELMFPSVICFLLCEELCRNWDGMQGNHSILVEAPDEGADP